MQSHDPWQPKTYDPLKAPDPKRWLRMDEQERILLVEQYHQRARVKLPNHRLHASIHAVVENQLAGGDPPAVGQTLTRLMGEGLDRHEALHALGYVLMPMMVELMKRANTPNAAPFDTAEYERRLRALTAQEWRHSMEE